ncbi:BNR-4 repeat-containing protein [Luteolibacter sp. Populi]|uniref:BNR-4 repeat-containing protein n=1 Tax=Luteolibacter sp. Populi TaxID=3230487 RepID=UPI003467016A
MRLLIIALFTLPATASIRGPYSADANTVHLFHLDEAAGTTSAANTGGASSPLLAFNGTSVPANGNSVQPANTAILGADAFSAVFGKAATLSTLSAGLGLDANGSGGFQPGTTFCPDAIDHSTLAGADGSFTLEALINLPAITGSSREIITTDSSLTNRGFQFRVGATGLLEFNFITGGGAAISAPIPVGGTHAFAANEWFHVALAFDGPTHTSTFYWTRLAADPGAPNVIGSSTAETTNASITGPLVIGNEGRGPSAEALLGLIDEVRISNKLRAPDEFLFEAPDLVTDNDNDQLPDSWELLHAPDLTVLSGLGGADRDLDGASDLAEYEAGSDPDDIASIPSDRDADGLPDSWEQTYFGNIFQTPHGDPDGDGESNATELLNGSAPNNRASLASDTDGEGLPDAWETASFATLAHNAGADPDGDGFGNLQELAAGTHANLTASRPPGTAVRLVPLDDGKPATSEFGYAGGSAINTVSFVRSSLKTVGNQQFVTWYGRHQFDPVAPFNNTIWIGRRTLGSSEWEVFRHPSFTANTITDGHDVISYGIDGDGFMHVSWGMHGDAFHYSRSTTPVTGSGPIALGPDTTMTTREATVTYPQFLKLPDGDLLFLFREGSSGSGNTFLNRYDTATQIWDNVHRSGSTQLPFIKGTGWTPDYNAYPNMPQLGGDGDDLLLTWCWRYNGGSPEGESGYQTNNNFAFARSPDAGASWQRFDSTPYALPISRSGESGDPATAAEHILTIPEGSSLINQASMCLDAAGHPVIASWWAPQAAAGDHRRQYMVVFRHDNGTWQTRPVSARSVDPAGTKYSENFVRNLGRPIVVRDDSDRIIVAYRDNRGSNGLTIVHSLPKAEDPDRLVWIEFDLTADNLGNYEPIIDNELWDRDRELHFLYQASAGEGYSPPANTAARFSILEWDAAAYFAHHPQPRIAPGSGQVTITCPTQPSWSYRLWSSVNLEDWALAGTAEGTGEPAIFTQPVNPAEPARYWRIEYAEGGF